MSDDLMRPIYEMQQNHRANRGAAEEIDAIDQVANHIEAQAAEITRLRAELATAQREVTGWQPIETAPKDGTVILGYRLDSRGDWEVFVTQWEKLEHRVGEKYSWRLLHADHYGALVYEDRLTHWTSMPDLPKEEKP